MTPLTPMTYRLVYWYCSSLILPALQLQHDLYCFVWSIASWSGMVAVLRMTIAFGSRDCSPPNFREGTLVVLNV